MPTARILVLDAASPLGAAILLRLAPGHDVVAHVPTDVLPGATGEFACRLVQGEAVEALAVEPGVLVVAPTVPAARPLIDGASALPERWIQCVDADDPPGEAAADALLAWFGRRGVATTRLRHAPLVGALVQQLRARSPLGLVALARRPGLVAPVADADVAEAVARLVARPADTAAIGGPDALGWAALIAQVRCDAELAERWLLAVAARLPARGRRLPPLPRVGRRRLADIIARLDAVPPIRPAAVPMADAPSPLVTTR